jgi:hypothetical protein
MTRRKKQSTEYAVAKPETIAQLDALAVAVRDGVGGAANPFSEALALAGAVVHLREALTPEVMSPIMALQSKPLGFRTDKDLRKTPSGYVKGDGYSIEVVRDAVIECCRRGARLVGNEFNLIGGRVYLTKEYFQRKIDDTIGRGNWRLFHELPRNASGGAIVRTRIEWKEGDATEWKTETVEFAIKGDGYSTADQYAGKADRKASAWLYNQLTGERLPEGDATETIDVTPKPYRPPSGAGVAEPAPAAAEPSTDQEAAPAAEAPETPPAAPRSRPMAEVLSEFREIVDIPGADMVNEYLRGISWIEADETFAKLREDRVRQVVRNRDAFIAAVFGENENQDVEV